MYLLECGIIRVWELTKPCMGRVEDDEGTSIDDVPAVDAEEDGAEIGAELECGSCENGVKIVGGVDVNEGVDVTTGGVGVSGWAFFFFLLPCTICNIKY